MKYLQNYKNDMNMSLFLNENVFIIGFFDFLRLTQAPLLILVVGWGIDHTFSIMLGL